MEHICNMEEIKISQLGHTWILDLDGTIVKHNGYKTGGKDEFLPGALEFLRQIPDKDMIIFLTSRTLEYKEITEEFLKKNKVKYEQIIFGVPYGERILVNDNKPSGMKTGIAINTVRDEFMQYIFIEDGNI